MSCPQGDRGERGRQDLFSEEDTRSIRSISVPRQPVISNCARGFKHRDPPGGGQSSSKLSEEGIPEKTA